MLRRRLLDLRRFQAGDAWRFALVIPVAMAIGALGVLLAFAPVAGAYRRGGAPYVLVRLSANPERSPSRRHSRESWLWGGLIALLAVASVALAVWGT